MTNKELIKILRRFPSAPVTVEISGQKYEIDTLKGIAKSNGDWVLQLLISDSENLSNKNEKDVDKD